MAPNAVPQGIQTDGVPVPNMPVPLAPFGPSVTFSDGMPRRSTGCTDQRSRPPISATFSANVRSTSSLSILSPIGGSSSTGRPAGDPWDRSSNTENLTLRQVSIPTHR